MNQTDTVEKLGKASKRAALMSLSGVIVVLLSLAYSIYQLSSLEKRKEGLNEDIKRLTTEKEKLTKSIEALPNTKLSQGQVFQLKASAKDIPGRTDGNGNPLYNFSVYVDASDDVLGKIARVTYDLHHPTIRKPHLESTDASNKFAVQYTGWGCVTEVDTTIYFRDGTTQPLPFDMCKSLGPEWSS